MRLYEVGLHIAAENMAEVNKLLEAVTQNESCLTCEIIESQTGKLTPILKAEIPMDPEPYKFRKGQRVYIPDLARYGDIVFFQGDDTIGIRYDESGLIGVRSVRQVQPVEE